LVVWGKVMILIQKSETADTRTCDVASVGKDFLLACSLQHIGDVVKAMAFFSGKLVEAAGSHDYDKLTGIDWFYSDFKTKFQEHGWWDNHRKIHRHHLSQEDGVPEDVNLLDVLEWIADCVMAGRARAGEIYPLEMSGELLQRAMQNTVSLLNANVSVADQ
jgi:ABC-type dipeptide/oligopeptide/nickel transport system ATPase component